MKCLHSTRLRWEEFEGNPTKCKQSSRQLRQVKGRALHYPSATFQTAHPGRSVRVDVARGDAATCKKAHATAGPWLMTLMMMLMLSLIHI